MPKAAAKKIYTIPSGLAFLDALATAVLAGNLPNSGGKPPDALSLSAITILVPTRRAARALADAFLRVSGGHSMILPAIRPLGDVGEEQFIFEPGGLDQEFAGPGLNLQLTIAPLERILVLAYLIKDWASRTKIMPDTPGQAIALAIELAALLDAIETESADITALKELVPAEQDKAKAWQITLDFMQIVLENWPQILAEKGVIEPMQRRNLLLREQAVRWRKTPPLASVIAAGSTGSIPATAALLECIASLPQGAVVLPGLDQQLDEDSWQAVDETHPQHGMKKLLAKFGISRDQVALMPGLDSASQNTPRLHLISEVLRPAETTGRWQNLATDFDDTARSQALEGLSVLHAPGLQEEALAIALILRHTLETPGKTAVLVTPDRVLARRVASEMARWNVDIDDSAGQPLADTPGGVFLRLILALIHEHFAPVNLLAFLKHPLTDLSKISDNPPHLLTRFEKRILRGLKPGKGIAGLQTRINQSKKPEDCQQLLDHLKQSFGPLIDVWQQEECEVQTLTQAHLQVAEALTRRSPTSDDSVVWSGESGESAAQFMAAMCEHGRHLGPIKPTEYSETFRNLIAGHVVRPRFGKHPRLAILGPLEARLLSGDVVILGSLNEGTWPHQTQVDPWLGRQMRREMGLASPEIRIGLAAHDFAQGVAGSEVILTRAEKVDGEPTVASRWLVRLQTVVRGMGAESALEPSQPWLSWAVGLDHVAKPHPVSRPAPKPPVELRPRQLSVTRIETLMRDPYAIFAREILKLRPLDPLEQAPGPAERGTLIHKILERYIKQYPDQPPDDPYDELVKIGKHEFTALITRPEVKAFWWPRFLRAAKWFTGQDQLLRKRGTQSHGEIKGEISFEIPGGHFTLTAKADRIDVAVGGGVRIIDYKTGSIPADKQVKTGFSPQLPLEAVIAKNGGFEGLKPAPIDDLLYIGLSGGEPPGEEKSLMEKIGNIDQLTEDSFVGLKKIVSNYEIVQTGYLSRFAPLHVSSTGDYDHLARVREWSADDGDDST